MEQSYSIQEVAQSTGLSVHTLRYYERVGLLDAVERAPNGYRLYSAADIAWVEFLNRLKNTGMSIRQMQQFADLRRQGDVSIGARRALLEAHHAEVEAMIRTLQTNLGAIAEKIQHYRQLEGRQDNE